MNECIFCKIGAGKINADVVYQNQSVIAFRDINPQAPVHLLIVPKKHIRSVAELAAEDVSIIGEIHLAAQELSKKEKLDKDGFRIVTNVGKNGGQTVDHLHYHLLGGRTMTWPPG